VQITATSTTFLGSAVTPTQDGLTAIRIRGQLLFTLTVSAAVNEGFAGAFGIGLATLAAVTVGATAVPTPRIEADWDGWLYHQFFALRSGGAIDGSVSGDHDITNAASAVLRIDVDTKAMRKLREEDSIYAIVDVVESGTCQMSADFDSRMLLKLP